MIVKSPCTHCGENIEFEAEDLPYRSVATCPNCNNATTLSTKANSITSSKSQKKELDISHIKNWISSHKIWSVAICLCFVFFLFSGFLSYHEQGFGFLLSLFFCCISAVFFIAALGFGFVIYFFPTIVARKRDHKNKEAILILNILTGWTFIGWVIAIVWAYSK